MSEYQLDIFGNEIPVTKLRKLEQKAKHKTSSSIRKNFREMNGYDERYVCEQCKKMGYGKGTDIEFNDKACKLYEKRWN